MQPIVVQKYGGSSVATADKIRQVAARVAKTCAAGKRVCVVVSAMGSTTNDLLGKAKEITSAPSRRELDMLLTCGERAAMALLSMAMHEHGIEAVSLTGSQSGIMTNDRHSGARIIEVRPIRVEDELAQGRVVIVAGFQGVSYKREITTLGRGGSDTTAVALAAALGAEYCEICSDVDGVYDADPRIVAAAELVDAISHDQMLELAAHGAKVLHAEAVEAARRFGVALYARATAGGGQGTRIDRAEVVGRLDRLGGVTGQKDLVRLGLAGEGAGSKLVALAAEHSLPVQDFRMRADGAVLVVPMADVPDWAAVKKAATTAHAELVIDEGLGSVSAVGDFVGRDAPLIQKVIEMTGDTAEVVTSPLRITAYCSVDKVDALVAALFAHLKASG